MMQGLRSFSAGDHGDAPPQSAIRRHFRVPFKRVHNERHQRLSVVIVARELSFNLALPTVGGSSVHQ